ncbi:MAG: methyltransferase family protein [Burkholderiales bacterium]
MWSRIAVVVILTYVVLGAPPKFFSSWLVDVAELVGFVFLSVAAMGRVWCIIFIAGVKNEVLVTDGPYSIVRNPLYVFSFLGAVGLGLAVENPLLALILGTLFAAFYPSVVRREEAYLASAHGSVFQEYCARTPRWVPNFWLYREPKTLTVVPAKIRKGIFDAMWFLWAFLLWEATEEFRQSGFLSTLVLGIPNWVSTLAEPTIPCSARNL